MEQFKRNIPLIGYDGQKILNESKVIVFGIGGVGGYICEALARAGVGRIDVVDGDMVDESNINRQIIADHTTIGKAKADLIKKRMLCINPKLKSDSFNFYFDSKNAKKINFGEYDYIIDAIDDVNGKILIIKEAKKHNVLVISAMGTGNKLDPTKFSVTDINKTSVCPLAKVVRKKLREEGIKNVKVLFSTEESITVNEGQIASISFVPSVAGLIMAREVILDLIELKGCVTE